MPVLLKSGTIYGIEAVPVQVEIDITPGLPAFRIVGLANQAVQEARERVRSALVNSGYKFPARRITINLAPGDLKKEGPQFDLPLAIGILAGLGKISNLTAAIFMVGELGLTGKVRPIRGVLPLLELAEALGCQAFIFPAECKDEIFFKPNLSLFPVNTLTEVITLLQADTFPGSWQPAVNQPDKEVIPGVDLADIRGQQTGKRAVEIAAAGRHNLILSGPPGTGKTLLARSLQGILPPLTAREALEAAAIASAAGKKVLKPAPPWRAPHHSISNAGLVGGGSYPSPGEITLAHRGILFLDEFSEFRRDILELLRQPLESGQINITRKSYNIDLPADFMLVAAMNPCPCGYYGSTWKTCRCSRVSIERYQSRLSGPLLDRIDIQLDLSPLQAEEVARSRKPGETSRVVRQRVQSARKRQEERNGAKLNSCLSRKELERLSPLEPAVRRFLQNAVNNLRLSARAVDKIYRLARTIADLGDSKEIEKAHLAEAISYRNELR